MWLDKQPYKCQNTKTYWNSVNKYLAMLHLHLNKPNIAYFAHYKILKFSNTIKVLSACLPACLLTGIDLEPIPLSIQPSNFMKIKVISVGTNLCYSNRNTHPVPSFVLCSFILTDWSSCLKQRCWHSISVSIPCKVLKCNSKQVG